MFEQRSVGMTLVEVLVSLLVIALIAALGLRAIDAIALNREGLIRVAAGERKHLLIMSQLEKDLQLVTRHSPVIVDGGLLIRDDTLILPGAVWTWGSNGLRRQDVQTKLETVYLSGPASLRLSMHSQDSLLAQPLIDDLRIPVRDLIALEVSLYAESLGVGPGTAGLRRLIDMRRLGS